ncbi:MAG: hypothetical protein ACXW14_05620 [Burkholderiaceae bacterium]
MELDFVAHVRDQVRTLLKIRCEREIPLESRKPGFGAKLVCGDIRMTVRAGMTDQLWRWLLDQGWREVAVRPDRRRYKDIPSTFVTRLIDAETNEDRARVVDFAIANAEYRPTMTRDGRIIPVRKDRTTKSDTP